MVIIPELQRFAYVTVETHSVHDIIRLQENLQAVEFLRGDLRGIPFVLKRTPVEISTPTTDGKRARREKWLLSIEVDPAWAALQLESMHRAALTVNGVAVDESRLLTTAYDDDEVEEDNIVESKTESIPSRVAEWLNQAKPSEAAKGWAVEVKAQPNIHAARSSLEKIVKEQFDGKFTTANAAQVLTAFYQRQQQHLAEQAAQPVETITVDAAEALPAF